MGPYLTIVIPLYNEEKNIAPLYSILKKVLRTIEKSYEIIFVDDGSKDKSMQELLKLKAKDRDIKIIQFQRNFGKSSGLNAAFKEASGDIIITMDADLQDRPEEIPKLIDKLNQGYDLVSGWKYKRYDSIGKRFPSKIMNFIARLISGAEIHDFNCGFKAYKKDVVKNIELYGDLHRYIPALAHWKGYSVGEVKVMHKKRLYGKSKYGFVRLMGAFDLVTIRFLNMFAKRPLHFFGPIGLLSFLIGGIMSLYLAIMWLQGFGIGNRPLLFLSILLIVIGVQFISLGLLGEMITNIGKKDDYIIKKKY